MKRERLIILKHNHSYRNKHGHTLPATLCTHDRGLVFRNKEQW